MSEQSRYWPRVGKTAFVFVGLYVVGMSFWCSSAGRAYKQHILDLDQAYHGASQELEAVHKRLAAQGVANPQTHPDFVKADAKLKEVVASHDHSQHDEFTGIDALRWTGIIGAGWLSLYFGVAGLWWKLRKSKPAVMESTPAA